MTGKNEQNHISNDEFLRGQSKLRFMIFPSPWRTMLIASKPETYVMGIKGCLSYLFWINQNGQMDLWKWTKVEHKKVNQTANELIKIFASEFDENMRYDIYIEAIMILKILNRLDEINTQKLEQIIQSYQIEDGGFKSITKNGSELKETLESVIALECINAKPLNCTALRDFVLSLQVLKSPYETRLYEFRENKEEGSDYFGTLKAYLILNILGFAIPYKEELKNKFEKELINIRENYTIWSQEEKRVKLFWLITRSYMFPEIGNGVRKELQSKVWEIHESLPEDHPFLKYTWGNGAVESFFSRTMTLIGYANPKIDVYFSPKFFTLEEKTHNCKLRINNSSPFEYHFVIKSIEVINESKRYIVQKPIDSCNYTIKTNENIEIPITIECKEESKILTNIELKISLTVPIMHLFWDLTNSQNLTSQIFFTIPIEENQTDITTQSNGGGSDEGYNYRKFILPFFTGTSLLTLGTVLPLIIKRKDK